MTIYQLYSLSDEDGLLYIGKTKVNPWTKFTRCHEHMALLRNGKHHSHKLQTAYNDGKRFSFAILAVSKNKRIIDKLEKNLIPLFGFYNIIYNKKDMCI